MAIFRKDLGSAPIDYTEYGESDTDDTPTPTSDPIKDHLQDKIWDRRIAMASKIGSNDYAANIYRAEFLKLANDIKTRLVKLYGASNVASFFVADDLPDTLTFNNEIVEKTLCLALLTKLDFIEDMGIKNDIHFYSLKEKNWIE